MGGLSQVRSGCFVLLQGPPSWLVDEAAAEGRCCPWRPRPISLNSQLPGNSGGQTVSIRYSQETWSLQLLGAATLALQPVCLELRP